MTRRANAYMAVPLLVGLLAMPSPGLAATGGAAIGGPHPGGPRPGSPARGTAKSGNGTVTASGGGITIATRASALLRAQLQFTGAVPRSRGGDSVEIERLGQTGGWVPTVHATARRNGSFTAVWQTDQIGRFAIRAVIEGRARAASASPRRGTSPSLSVTVYRPAIATLYGPGFYGRKTACGEVLRPSTVGVANRTLPCGTPVSIYYRGLTIVVPVIDRGPYANHADWDLTEATGKALRMDGTATIGAVPLAQG